MKNMNDDIYRVQDQLWEKVCHRIDSKVRWQVQDQVRNQVRNQFPDQVLDQLIKVEDQLLTLSELELAFKFWIEFTQ